MRSRQLESATVGWAGAFRPDLGLTRDAMASSALNHGLLAVGDRWTTAVLLGAFTGLKRFEEWQTLLGIPRPTLAHRLRKLVTMGLLRQRSYQDRPRRLAYHLTQLGLGLYGHVLMIWAWERRWGTRRDHLPARLVHRPCGQALVPVLGCQACGQKTSLADLGLALKVNRRLLAASPQAPRSGRIAAEPEGGLALGQRLDRWTLLIVAAVILGCHHFDQLQQVLGISPSVLSRRLAAMMTCGLLQSHADLQDARRQVYRLTPASRDLFGTMACFSTWASRELLRQPSSIRPVHQQCGQPFQAIALCAACGQVALPWEVDFDPVVSPR